VFVNPALTEPFGLTLLEAAASGLPVVATDDGGPRDILHSCQNGLLVDVSDREALQRAMEESFGPPSRWSRWRDNGIEAVSRHFSWDAHGCRYLGEVQACCRTLHASAAMGGQPRSVPQGVGSSPLPVGCCWLESGIQ
jgi:sucrose-phosphate synthase